ncbi:MAG: NUDIX domain-containing protein, partial [Proteobacteria bacterium]
MKSKISEQDLLFLGERLRSHYREIVVDGFIYDPDKKAMLLQKRSPTRRLFPNFWDTLGGHLEGQESISECLKREVYEESGLHLTA